MLFLNFYDAKVRKKSELCKFFQLKNVNELLIDVIVTHLSTCPHHGWALAHLGVHGLSITESRKGSKLYFAIFLTEIFALLYLVL